MARKGIRKRSLAFTLAVAFLSLAMSILLIMSVLEVSFNIQNRRSFIYEEQGLIAQQASEKVKSFIQEKMSLLAGAVRIGDIAGSPAAEKKSALDKLIGLEPSFRQLVLLDMKKSVVAESSRLSSSQSGRLAERVGSDMLSLTSQGKPYISEVYIDDTTSEPMVAIAVPVTNALGDHKGALLAEVNLKFMWDLVDSIKVGDTGFAYVVDGHGSLIAFSDVSRVLEVEDLSHLEKVREFLNDSMTVTGYEVSKGINGNDVVSTFVPLGIPDWAIVVELPVEEANAPIIQQMVITLLLIILSFALTIAISVYLSRRITKPLIRLRDAAAKIGAGELDSRIDIKSKDEVGDLASAFNQMVDDLSRSRRELEKHKNDLEKDVSKRTRDLNEKMGDLEKSRLAVLNMMEDADQSNKDLLDAQSKLQKSFVELKKLDSEKDTFISIAAHELKTPMTAIHGFAQLLESDKVIKDPEMRNKYLKIIEHEVDRLAKLVTEVLDLSRVDLGTIKFTIEDVDVSKVAEEVSMELVEKARSRHLTLNFKVEKGLPPIRTDSERLKQILINLVDNSIKYAEKGGTTVSITREKDYMKFAVADKGIGIPKEQQAKMFTRFYQIENPLTRKVGGTGLGLSICKEFVEALGGRIWFESKVGKGSTFYFTLPIVPKAGRPAS